MVSPAGKSPDDQWPVQPGNVHAKDDFSHAYVHASAVDSPCDTDPDLDTVLHLGGHVGDNEGSHFWGFEFMKNEPGGFANLTANNGTSFTLDFSRSVGDILVSFTVPGNSSEQVQLELFRVTGFNGDGSAQFTPVSALPGCPTGPPDPKPQGFSALTSNSTNQVKAPPWNVPVCDPTADNGANTCRLAIGTNAAEDLLAQRDFAEASVDLQAFGINPCFTNVVFSSRSSHPLEGADVKDVGGGTSRSAGRRRASSSTTATPTASRTPATRRSRTGRSSSTGTGRRQGPRGHRRRGDRKRRNVDRHRDDRRQRGLRVPQPPER